MSLRLTSPAFQNEGVIPDKYAKQDGNISPPLAWSGVPKETTSLVLIVDDLDAPSGLFVHWIVYGIAPDTSALEEGLPPLRELPNGARQGANGFSDLGYGGPQPPSGTHRYVFHLYALDTDSTLPAGMSVQEVDGIIEGHVIEEALLIGKYQSREQIRAAS